MKERKQITTDKKTVYFKMEGLSDQHVFHKIQQHEEYKTILAEYNARRLLEIIQGLMSGIVSGYDVALQTAQALHNLVYCRQDGHEQLVPFYEKFTLHKDNFLALVNVWTN